MSRRVSVFAVVAGVLLAVPGSAMAGHGLAAMKAATLDHPAPAVAAPIGLPLAQSGGPGAQWEYIASFATGDPAHGPRLLHPARRDVRVRRHPRHRRRTAPARPSSSSPSRGEVQPRYVSNQPSAECTSEPSQALGLQHDVEADAQGRRDPERREPERGAHATRSCWWTRPTTPGRCHDQGTPAGITGAPQGGLELIDVTDVSDPVEIGLTSHAGEAHTVNIDPKRPHIAYAVTSDAVSVDAAGQPRENEIPGEHRPARPRRLRGRGHVLVHVLHGRHHRAGAARPLPAEGLPLPLPERRRSRSATPRRARSTAATSSRSTPTTGSPAAAAPRRSCST